MSKLLIYKNYQSLSNGYLEDLPKEDCKHFREVNDTMEYDNIDYTDCFINNRGGSFCFFDDVMNINLQIKTAPRYKNFELTELKISLEIARKNLSIDTSNKYYQKEFERVKCLINNFS